MSRRSRARRPQALWFVALWLLLAAGGRAATPAGDAGFTFFLISDLHVGSQNPKAVPPVTPEDTERHVRNALARLLTLAHEPYPARGPFKELGTSAAPAEAKGILIAGDLTDGAPDRAGCEAQWNTYDRIFPAAGITRGSNTIPAYPAWGNHDGGPGGPVPRGLIAQHRARLKAGAIAALSDNGFHYAVQWGPLHLICVNLYPADAPDLKLPFRFGDGGRVGGWNDPQGAFTFLTNYLGQTVGRSGDPVIIMQHYGFDGFSLNDWNWWTPALRRAYYEAIKGYNILAIFHGHDHAAEHYYWPDPQANPLEVKSLFGDTPPADLRRFDVFSAGHLAWVFRVQHGRLFALHHDGRAWTTRPDLMVTKPLR